MQPGPCGPVWAGGVGGHPQRADGEEPGADRPGPPGSLFDGGDGGPAMNSTKRARPGAGTPGRAGMGAGTGQASTSIPEFTTPPSLGQGVGMNPRMTGVQRFVRSAQHRAREILQTARAIEGVSI